MGHRHIEEHVVVNGETHERAYQFEVDIWLESLPVKPIELNILVELEHTILRVEKLFHDKTKIFLHHAAHIDTRFVFKLSFQGKFQRI
jgi:hypothetical protein